jgi:hypothetical protein
MALLKDLVLRIVIDLRRRSPRTPGVFEFPAGPSNPGAPSVNP